MLQVLLLCLFLMLRVSFMHQFRRGKLADLVSLLSGRDFETKEFREDIIADSYDRMDKGILNFANEYNFNQFVLAIKGAGFVSHKLLNSAMTLDFAYTLYLILLDAPEIPNDVRNGADSVLDINTENALQINEIKRDDFSGIIVFFDGGYITAGIADQANGKFIILNFDGISYDSAELIIDELINVNMGGQK